MGEAADLSGRYFQALTTGREVSAPFVTVLEVSGGRITAHRPYWDLASFMQQLTG